MKEKIKRIINLAKPELNVILAYLIFFIANEIIISGWKAEGNIYTVIFNAIVVLTVLWIFRGRYYKMPIRARIIEGVTYALTFAVLDFLLVNLLFYKFNFYIYSQYYTYIYYGLLLLIPIGVEYFPPLWSKIYAKLKTVKIKNPLDKQISNHIIR